VDTSCMLFLNLNPSVCFEAHLSLESVNLTRLPADVTSRATPSSDASNIPSVEYSSREVCPPQLLIQQLCSAHSIFLLHHDTSLGDLYQRVGRSTCCGLLNRFWTKFIRNWEVLLNGNPTVSILNGIKLAAGGELGIGVGEEEWGSGEREVLEHFVSRTDGLLDLVVSRFGDASKQAKSVATNKRSSQTGPESNQSTWPGSDICPRPADGVIFSGVGYIAKSSLCQVSQWMEWIYRYGDAAYGVGESPSSMQRRRRHKRRATTPSTQQSFSFETESKPASKTSRYHARDSSVSPRIPPPLVTATSPSPSSPVKRGSSQANHKPISVGDNGYDSSGLFGTESLMKYLTLGYGSSWGIPSISNSPQGSYHNPQSPPLPLVAGVSAKASQIFDSIADELSGRFIIGLRDDLEEDDGNDESMGDTCLKENKGAAELQNTKTVLRTLHIRMADSVVNTDSTGMTILGIF
jgi:hypothetical protein